MSQADGWNSKLSGSSSLGFRWALLAAAVWLIVQLLNGGFDRPVTSKTSAESITSVDSPQTQQGPTPAVTPAQSNRQALAQPEDVNCDYKDFYAQVRSKGLPVGQRFRFTAVVNEGLYINDTDYRASKQLAGYEAFDNKFQYQEFLKSDTSQPRTVVASVDQRGDVQIHAIE